ncbi:MAG: aspartate 1-decarboxylase [Deltaproteobacteria bacterium]|nr:aspartate 1-decarboxylase [Deltaproteobacteria bacterium]
MTRSMLKGKIHRATVTGADLHYEGSITIDQSLMDAADILPYEEVRIYNVNNGERFETYAIPGPRDSGVICINGAAAHKASRDDIVIIACFGLADAAELRHWQPSLVYVDAANRIAHRKAA